MPTCMFKDKAFPAAVKRSFPADSSLPSHPLQSVPRQPLPSRPLRQRRSSVRPACFSSAFRWQPPASAGGSWTSVQRKKHSPLKTALAAGSSFSLKSKTTPLNSKPASNLSAVGAPLAAPAARNPKKTQTIKLATHPNGLPVGGRVHRAPGVAVGLYPANAVVELQYH